MQLRALIEQSDYTCERTTVYLNHCGGNEYTVSTAGGTIRMYATETRVVMGWFKAMETDCVVLSGGGAAWRVLVPVADWDLHNLPAPVAMPTEDAETLE